LLLFIAHDVTEQVRSQEERRRLLSRLLSAQEEERTRIASDIHDDPIQAMTAVGFRLEALRRMVDDPETSEMLTGVTGSVSKAVDRLRHLMFELRPPSLDQIGIAAALKEYVRKEVADENSSFALVSDLPKEPDAETRAIVYRLAQEALINVRKHARARRVDVTLSESEDGVLTRIHDDGVGFHPARGSAPGHMGLMSMRERASLAGGWFTVDSVPGGGTTVEFWIPLRSERPTERASRPAGPPLP
jgi:signal transduction histidine kinase